MAKGNGNRNAFDMSNQTSIAAVQTVGGAALDSHTNPANPSAHQITSIDSLQDRLDDKVNVVDIPDFSASFTGDVVIITAIDFTLETTTTSTLQFTDGVLTGVI